MRTPASLKWQLPLLVSCLIGSAILVMGWLASLEVGRFAHGAARERIENRARTLAKLLDRQVSAYEAKFLATAEEEPLARFLVHGEERAAALRILQRLASRLTDAVELRDPDGRLVLSTDERSPAEMPGAPFTGTHSLLFVEPGTKTPRYHVRAPVELDDRQVGALVERRRLSTGPEALQALSNLFEPESVLLLGNPEGDVWSNLLEVVPAPPAGVLQAEHHRGTDYERAGERRLGVVTPLIDGPWWAAVELPHSAVYGPARSSRLRFAWISLSILAVGAAGAWFVSRGITKPLHELTRTAMRIAAGERDRRAPVGRTDEIGALANAFNTMVDRVDEGQRSLEAKVAERTAQIAAALQEIGAINATLRREIADKERAELEVATLNSQLSAQLAELQMLNRDLESFSYTVSHDLRTPLRAINGYSQALIEDLQPTLATEHLDYLQRSIQASQRMSDLIDGLLLLSQVGRVEPRRAPVDLSALARRIVRELQADQPRPVAVEVQDGLHALGDERLLSVVLENLLGNSWKFTRDVTAPRIEFGARDEDGETVFFVRDNGVGFDMAHTARLFTPFHRLHADEAFPGTGVGLATVRRVGERHGGRIWASSAPGAGATFYWTTNGGPAT